MAGYICALAISLFAVVAGSFCMVYPLYHKHVCKEPATAKVIDIHKERRDGTCGTPIRYSNIGPMDKR